MAESESPLDDPGVFDRFRRGEPRAVGLLSDRYRDRLVAYANRVVGDRDEAEDVVQEVFFRAPKASRLRDARSLIGWLYAVCYRLAVDRLRERNRRSRALEALLPAGPAEPAAIEAERRDEADRAQAALAGLDEPYRTAVRLRYLDGLEFPEIAHRMGTIERTARTWVGRGLTRLRERLLEA